MCAIGLLLWRDELKTLRTNFRRLGLDRGLVGDNDLAAQVAVRTRVGIAVELPRIDVTLFKVVINSRRRDTNRVGKDRFLAFLHNVLILGVTSALAGRIHRRNNRVAVLRADCRKLIGDSALADAADSGQDAVVVVVACVVTSYL